MGETNKPAREGMIYSRGSFLLSVCFLLLFAAAFSPRGDGVLSQGNLPAVFFDRGARTLRSDAPAPLAQTGQAGSSLFDMGARARTGRAETMGVGGVVKRVVDGDTVELTSGEYVRYAGIDAPELRRLEGGRWIEAPEAFGVLAYRLNQRLVEHRPVDLEFDETKRDNYHRLLAYLYADGFLVNAIIVREGLALVSLYPPNLKYADLLLSMQRKAWEEKRGIWSKPLED